MPDPIVYEEGHELVQRHFEVRGAASATEALVAATRKLNEQAARFSLRTNRHERQRRARPGGLTVLTIDLPSGGSLKATYCDFGKPVDVAPPTAGETVDATAHGAAILNG